MNLDDGNRFNIEIKDFLDTLDTNNSTREFKLNQLREYQGELAFFIDDINDHTPDPADNGLIKENILATLEDNLERVNETLANMEQTGGRRRKSRRSRKSRGRRKSRRSRKTLRRKSLKRRRH